MSRLTNWLLIPPVSSRLSERYRHYRHHGASSLSAALGCFRMILAWMFIPLEHPRWQRIRARHGELYPHINPDKPRPLDPARYAIQSTHTGAGLYYPALQPAGTVYLPDPAVGRGSAGAAHSGAFFCPDADRAVADRFLPLHLVAIYLNAELGRSGQPGVWVSAAVC